MSFSGCDSISRRGSNYKADSSNQEKTRGDGCLSPMGHLDQSNATQRLKSMASKTRNYLQLFFHFLYESLIDSERLFACQAASKSFLLM